MASAVSVNQTVFPDLHDFSPAVAPRVGLVVRRRTRFAVSRVHATHSHTDLTRKKPGDRVDIETDNMARFVETQLVSWQ